MLIHRKLRLVHKTSKRAIGWLHDIHSLNYYSLMHRVKNCQMYQTSTVKSTMWLVIWIYDMNNITMFVGRRMLLDIVLHFVLYYLGLMHPIHPMLLSNWLLAQQSDLSTTVDRLSAHPGGWVTMHSGIATHPPDMPRILSIIIVQQWAELVSSLAFCVTAVSVDHFLENLQISV